MSYFVNVRTNEVMLREGQKPIADLYDACGRAALLASDLTAKYLGTMPPSNSLAVEVIGDGGNVLFRVPVQRFDRS